MNDQLPPTYEAEDYKFWSKDAVIPFLDDYAEENGLKSLRDRVNLGLNMCSVLAVPDTRGIFQEICNKIAGSPEEGQSLLEEVQKVANGIQSRGPWDYTDQFRAVGTPLTTALYILAGVEIDGYENEKRLNAIEFHQNVERIYGNLRKALANPKAISALYQNDYLEKFKARIRFDDEDVERAVPIGEGFPTTVTMALEGYVAGVVQDADGEIYVTSSKEISTQLIQSCGLRMDRKADDVDPTRTVEFFYNEHGMPVFKRVHSGLLVIITDRFEPAVAVVKALNEGHEELEIPKADLDHLKVAQETEKHRAEIAEALEIHRGKMERVRDRFRALHEAEAPQVPNEKIGPLICFLEEYCLRLWNTRTIYVYLDSLHKEETMAKLEGREITKEDKQRLYSNTSRKMWRKVEEVRFILDALEDYWRLLPPNQVDSILDLAAGGGDFSLAIGERMVSLDRNIRRIKAVDPMPGTSVHMDMIVSASPSKDHFEEVAQHDGAKLQHVKMHKNEMVTAKHACASLSDHIIESFIKSDSPILVMMTCCQHKAVGDPARYGFEQAEWDRLCKLTEATKTDLDTAGDKPSAKALKKLAKGKAALLKLDIARIEHLRNQGFQVELRRKADSNSGNVIIARRLPANFDVVQFQLQRLRALHDDSFASAMSLIVKLMAGEKISGNSDIDFGKGWLPEDYRELYERVHKTLHDYSADFDLSEIDAELQLVSHEGQQKAARKKIEKQRARAAKTVFLSKLVGDLSAEPTVTGYLKAKAEERGEGIDKKTFGAISGQLGVLIARVMSQSEEPDPEVVRAEMDEIISRMWGDNL